MFSEKYNLNFFACINDRKLLYLKFFIKLNIVIVINETSDLLVVKLHDTNMFLCELEIVESEDKLYLAAGNSFKEFFINNFTLGKGTTPIST